MLRIDRSVVETDLHFPVDSTLLGDGVRILNRAIQRARQRVQPVGEQAQASFRDRTRSIRKGMRRLITATPLAAELWGDDRQLDELPGQMVSRARR